MATKLITELPLRSDFDDSVNVPGDDTIQTYRITGAQIRSFLSPFYQDQVGFMKNVGLEISTNSGAMTIALKQKNGSSDPTTGINSTEISFRSPTITNPNEVIVAFDSALSITIPSGATLGYISTQAARVFVYAYFDGTNKGLAVSSERLNESLLYNSIAIDINADDISLYADASRTGAAIRLLGTIVIDSIGTAGVWTSPSRSSKFDFLDILPPGMVMPFAGGTTPHGFLLCNGQAISRSLYARLFNALGVRYGVGNGSTTFNLPDYRGRFLRGTNYSTGRDPNASSRTAMNTGGATGDNLGSVQLDALQDHEHVLRYQSLGGQSGGSFTSTVPSAPLSSSALGVAAEVRSTARVSTETRPINAYIDYYIKY